MIDKKSLWRPQFSAFGHVLFLLAFLASPLFAEVEKPTLRTGWVLSPPLWEYGLGKQKAGYFIELAQMIADELEYDLVVQEYETLEELINAQNSGETDLIAGGTALELFESDNVFSVPVGRTQSRLFVHTDNLASFDPNFARDEAIGSMLSNWAPEMESLLARNKLVVPKSTGEAIIGLLSREFDALLYPQETIAHWTHRSGIDHIVVPTGAPFNFKDRVVVLHRSRADLLVRINQAISKFEANGILAELQAKHSMTIYEPVPDVLTVGYPLVSGYGELAETGLPEGFAVDFFSTLAGKLGLRYELKPLSVEALHNGPNANGCDIILFLADTPERRKKMDFTSPVESMSFSFITTRRNPAEITSLKDLEKGIRTGVVSGGPPHNWVKKQSALAVSTYETLEEMLTALSAGEVDTVLIANSVFAKKQRDRFFATSYQLALPSVYSFYRSIALRKGLGSIREQLNTEIPLFLVSDEYAEFYNRHFSNDVFWTASRLRIAAVVFGVLIILLSGLVLGFFFLDRARRREKHLHETAEASRLDAETQKAQTKEFSGRLQAVMNAASNGIIALDHVGQVAIANPKARELLQAGNTPVPFDGTAQISFSEKLEGNSLMEHCDPFSQILKGKQLIGEVYYLYGLSSRPSKQVRMYSSPLEHGVSDDIGTVVILEDVTEIEGNRAEAERIKRLSSLGQFTGGVAHDFNNLLSIIMGNLELLSDHLKEDQKLHKYVDSGLRASERGAELTNSLLSFAKNARLDPKEIDMSSTLQKSENWMRRVLPETIVLETSYPEDVWQVKLDESALENALLNLVLNARDAMGGQGKLTIEVGNREVEHRTKDCRNAPLEIGSYVYLSVSDTGTGIEQDVLDLIFDPFFTTKGPTQGSGIGLSMVQGFVEQSGGSLQVFSKMGKGTTFELFFPVVSKACKPPVAVETNPKASAPSHEKILIVEDEEQVRGVLETILIKEGFQVTSAASGDAAFELIRSNPHFDLVITDHIMPGKLQGVDLAIAIREHNSKIPIMALSGYSDELSFHENWSQLFAARLSKPVRKQDLLGSIRKCLMKTISMES